MSMPFILLMVLLPLVVAYEAPSILVFILNPAVLVLIGIVWVIVGAASAGARQ